jgi:glycosyltransferase involved in cell wall biosynthesis
MRIALVNHEYTLSGASVMLLKIADHLLRAGHRCALVPMLSTPGPIEAEYVRRGIPILSPAPFREFDAAICNTVYTALAVRVAAKATRAIWWIREAEAGRRLLEQEPQLAAAFGDAAAIGFQTAYQRDAVYRDFLAAVDSARAFVIPNGVELPASGPCVAKTRPIRAVCVGAVDLRKRQGDLIRAVEATGRKDIECAIIGRLWQLDPAAQAIAAREPDRFRLLGELPHEETVAWLRSADIFALPSVSESQPGAALEAALAGSALVLTDLAVYRGVWRHGENALLHPVANLPALAAAIGALVADPALRLRLAQAARATALQFSNARHFAAIDALLTRVVG